jgi:phosphatidylserine synthase
MTGPVAYLIAIGVTFVINVPFGYWRAGVRKFSPQWFLAVHAAVPLVIALRFALGLPFRWSMLPFFVATYVGGQYAGSRLRPSRSAQPNRP